MMNKLDVSYISSVSFEDPEVREIEDIEESSENSVIEESGIGSYYSISQSELKMKEEE